MYTQIRGFLCCDSIGVKYTSEEFIEKIDILTKDYLRKNKTIWAEDLLTINPSASNGSKWIFIGSEGKDYEGNRADFISYIIHNIPCEGRIEFQYEENGIGDIEEVWKVHKGITVEKYILHTEGYGFC